MKGKIIKEMAQRGNKIYLVLAGDSRYPVYYLKQVCFASNIVTK